MRKLLYSLVIVASFGTASAQTGGDKPKPAGDAAGKAPPAAAAPEAGMPKPPDWSAWKWFLGTWKCAGSLTIAGNKADVKLTLTHKADLDGFFVVQTANAPKSKTNPMALKWTAYMTMDANGSRYVVATNSGGTEAGTGPAAWSGDTLEFSGQEASAMGKMDFKHTWKKVSDKEFHWTGNGTGGPGTSFEWTCKK